MSSISTITTLGALCGAVTSKRGGAFAFRASSSVIGAYLGGTIGKTVRSMSPSATDVSATAAVSVSGWGSGAAGFWQPTMNATLSAATTQELSYFLIRPIPFEGATIGREPITIVPDVRRQSISCETRCTDNGSIPTASTTSSSESLSLLAADGIFEFALFFVQPHISRVSRMFISAKPRLRTGTRAA